MNNRVHLVVPCYRESGRIGVFLHALCRELTGFAGATVQVVEDGSDSAELRQMTVIIDNLRLEYECLLPLKVLPQNLGKGGAVYAGWGDHQGADWLAFVDADGACAASEVSKLLNLAIENPEPSHSPSAIFASRVKMLGRQVDRLFQRHLLGRIYATLVSETLDIPVYDSQCGLKVLPRVAFERIQEHLVIRGFAFDVELMVALLDTGCPIREIPIDWREVAGGKVNLLRDSWLMARDVMRIRSRRYVWKSLG